jgi:hypothetical protein
MRVAATVAIITLAATARLLAVSQAPAGGGRGTAAASARQAAPIDLTGYWVSIVNEDWRWRMVTPPKGDYPGIPLNAEGRKVADSWTPALDGRCEAYGAAGLMRMPTRVRIEWQDDNTLKLETDAGTQTRTLRFTASTDSSATARTLQGNSVASWQFAGARGGRGGGGAIAPAAGAPGGASGGRGAAPAPGRGGATSGSLRVVTTNLLPGWFRRNGLPYSEDALLTEYFDRFRSTNGDEWFVVTTVLSDATYLQQDYVTSSHFKKEPDGSKWAPTSCRSS